MAVSEQSVMQIASQQSYLSSGEDYLEALYELYLANPESVSGEWRNYFQSLGAQEVSHEAICEYFRELAKHKSTIVSVSGDIEHERKQALVKELLYSYRTLGHLHARLDPLSLAPVPVVPQLDPSFYRFTAEDLDKVFHPDRFADNKPLKLRDLIKALQEVYCRSIGTEYMHITNQTEIHWIQQRLENPVIRQTFIKGKQKRILACLTAAEGLEKYLGSKYVGQKRFSLEGGDSVIPLLDELIQHAGMYDVKEIIIGMAHRGRLNVLVNILGKAVQDLFKEFEGKVDTDGRSGDVKYHMGFSSDVKTEGGPVHLALSFNPSHLEIISPVAIGSVRARQQRRGLKNRSQVLGVQLHGDAAFAGQGVVMETFALSQTHGFGTGGTLHIIVNNQIGFTTDPNDARSTYYCTDIAKMVQAPIFHVNGDDPESVLFVTQMAHDYRMTFGKDVVIDMICYRRHGHNEADEPSATQPVMYQQIKKQPTVRQRYAEYLVQAGVITQEEADNLVNQYRDAMDASENHLPALLHDVRNPLTIDWTPYINQSLLEKADTSVKRDVLKKLATCMNTLPEGMVLQPQVAKIIEDQRKMTAGEIPLNWGYAENLAYATLLNEGFSVRLTGQDCGRGTFAHRHAVLHDFNNGKIYIPLQHIDTKADFSIYDSILSEVAVLAFEYGYTSSSPNTLVLWEAQFGDFANGAQVVIDQFISSGEQKWGRLCGLVMLLPHGYEGMGPEHSSARLERYLQLCAQDNIQIFVPTTPAQIFHLLRRQMIRSARKPLIVMTPKSLLRHKLATSSLDELSSGQLQLLIPEIDHIKPSDTKRLILCSGKIYYELLEKRCEKNITNICLVRIEQLYPLPDEELQKLFASYKKTTDIIWCQEEPRNQGAWYYIKKNLQNYLGKGQALRYVGRELAAAPAVGSSKLHTKEQQQIINEALQGN
jgi:2-oxoglutarate dehydrogenase E1 component